MRTVAIGSVAWTSNRLDVFGVDTGNQMVHKDFDGVWHPSMVDWEDQGGTLLDGPPVVVSWSPGRLDIFGLGGDNQLHHKFFDGAWHPWEPMGGPFSSDPTVVSWGANRLDIFALDASNQVQHRVFDGAWHPWEAMGPAFGGPPTAICWGPNRLDLFALRADGQMVHKSFDGSWHPSMTEWEDQGGVALAGPPAVASWGAGRLDIFGLGRDGQIHHKVYDGDWRPWETMSAAGDRFDSLPTVVSWGPGRLDVFALDATDQVQHKAFDGAWHPSMTGWESLGGICTTAPTVVSWGPGRLDLFVLGTDYGMFHKVFDGAWRPSMSDWESLGGTFSVPPITTGTIRPRYEILTVVYAPPGSNGGKSSSQVDYGSGSSTGTKTTTTSSFKDTVKVTATGGVGILTADASFQFAHSTTDSSAVAVTKSRSYDIKIGGPSADGIDHDHDLFYLWLNPKLDVAIDASQKVQWAMNVDGSTPAGAAMDIVYVYAGQLKNPSMMSPDVRKRLDAAGLTAADYAHILSCDPFASGTAPIDSNRFLLTTQSFPYIPPYSAADSVPTQTYVQQSTVTTVDTHTTQVTYTVSADASVGLGGVWKAKAEGSLEWTNTSSSEATAGSSQSASVTVGGPAFGYTGPTDVLVYWDTVFSSFMFAFPTEPPTLSGILKDANGKPIAHTPVQVNVGAHVLEGFTGPDGSYRFYGASANATVSAKSAFHLAQRPPPRLR